MISNEPTVPSGHVHAYMKSETLAPGCEYGGYTLEKCSCGSCRMTGFTSAKGHSLLHAAYRLEDGELNGDSLVAYVTYCTVCGVFSEKKTCLSDLSGVGITAGSVKPKASDIVFSAGGVTVAYEPVSEDLSTHVCPNLPSAPRPVSPQDITKLDKFTVPSIAKNDRNKYPVSAVMRDGSVVNAYWTRSGGSLTLKVINSSMGVEVGDCAWGWAPDMSLGVWVFGVWYRPQANTWYFTMHDTDSRFN